MGLPTNAALLVIEVVHGVSLGNINEEFVTVVDTSSVLASLNAFAGTTLRSAGDARE